MVAMAIRSGLWLRPFFLVSVSKLDRDETEESRAYARAEQEQSDFEKAKGSVDEGRLVYESKKRVAARPYDGTGAGGGKARDGRREREDRAAMERNRARERGRYDEKGGKDEEEGAATPGAILLEFK